LHDWTCHKRYEIDIFFDFVILLDKENREGNEQMAIEIIATGRAVPPRRVTNDELAAKLETSDEWIRSHTGIAARHIAGEGVATSDLAVEAANHTLAMAAEKTGENTESIANSIDVIILATTTADFPGCPSTACIVQDRIGALNASAMDISACCTGFIYGLETAASLLEARAWRKRALVIGAEVLSRITNWEDRGSAVLFGDGAGAVLIEKTDALDRGPDKRGLLYSILKADGSGNQYLCFKNNGSRNPAPEQLRALGYEASGSVSPTQLVMDGRAVYNFAVKAETSIVTALLEKAHISVDALAWIVPHQANARIIQAAAKRLGIPEEKFFINIDEYANTSAASIPIALDELNRNGRIKRGDLILTMGFGGGLTWGGNLIVW
jgi:3-oxoacyl-[acyl-carrier-protein] synthase-3